MRSRATATEYMISFIRRRRRRVGVVIIAYYLLTARWCLCSDDVVMAKAKHHLSSTMNRGARKMHSENHVLAWGASSAIIFIASRSVDIGKLC